MSRNELKQLVETLIKTVNILFGACSGFALGIVIGLLTVPFFEMPLPVFAIVLVVCSVLGALILQERE